MHDVSESLIKYPFVFQNYVNFMTETLAKVSVRNKFIAQAITTLEKNPEITDRIIDHEEKSQKDSFIKFHEKFMDPQSEMFNNGQSISYKDFSNKILDAIPLKRSINFYSLNYWEGLIHLFTSLESDMHILKQTLLKDKEDYEISAITILNSDIHKKAGGVKILEFKKAGGEDAVKIVFKPSSISMDYAITANTSRIGKVVSKILQPNGNIKKFRSFIEIINMGFESLSKDEKF